MTTERPLGPAFFNRDPDQVARELLGCQLVHDSPDGRMAARIVETEAYGTDADSACYAARGSRRRHATIHGPPGVGHLYCVYGHTLLNVVAAAEGTPGAVLIRAVTPLAGEALMVAHRNGRSGRELANGPGKLTRAMAIARAHFDRTGLYGRSALFFAAGDAVPDSAVTTGPRIGIDYADPVDRDAPRRFRLMLR
ncbi:DNA-3-methyladenine glycosylase [Kushneria sinocarnis]|uniref:Putative 3-methyladenine DNA glycosylase n=1 Tax=Kushneria sinocarnis TaxID=595502 RepID=A0A420X0Z1_9GAMM|nr:DNA-3-methyladenine glycosylase [Kushneria sinocarnis]RKR07528.1 DNA-3-methyladenine glycosylase [Kushneria sinocarnis]